MTILVTGATGYVGGRLVGLLLQRGHRVIGASRTPNQPPQLWPAEAPLTRFRPDQAHPVSLETLGEVDTVVHLAAANEIRSAADVDGAIADTVVGTRRLLADAIASGVRRFIFLSTIHVYGRLLGKITESSAVLPIHPYAITHLAAEHFVRAAHEQGELTGMVVRLSNAVGAPAWPSVDRWSLAGNDFALQAVRDGIIHVKAPDQWRDFIVLGDVCRALEILLANPVGRPSEGGVFNVGAGASLQIADVAALTAEAAESVLQRPISVQFDRPNTASAPPFTFDTTRLRSLGFRGSGRSAIREEMRATVRLVAESKKTG